MQPLNVRTAIQCLLGALLLTSSVACHNSDSTRTGFNHSGNGFASLNPVQRAPAEVSDKHTTRSEGTSQGGGGNGLDGKLFESFIRNPMDFPAFKEIVVKALQPMKSTPAEQKSSSNIKFGLKTWFFIPGPLKNVIPSRVLGVSFLEGTVNLYAFQTAREIWVDRDVFARMTLEEQATLLIHEHLMSIYLTKFMKVSELCETLRRAGDPKACSLPPQMDVEDWNQTLPPVPFHELNDTDYANIRTMTNWLVHHGSSATHEQFLQMAWDNGFDRRFSTLDRNGRSDQQDGSTPKEVSFTGKEIHALLNRAKYAERLPSICEDPQTGTVKECSIRWAAETLKMSLDKVSFEQKVLRLQVLDNENRLVGETFMALDSQTSSGISRDMTGRDFIILYPPPIYDLNPQPGKRLFNILFHLEQKGELGQKPQWELQSLILQSAVITEILTRAEAEAEAKKLNTGVTTVPACRAEKLKGQKNWFERTLIMRSEGQTLPAVLRSIVKMWPPMVLCYPPSD